MEFRIIADDGNEDYVDDPVLGVGAATDATNENHNPEVVTPESDAETKQGDALLVMLVASYPILFDKSQSDYKNIVMRDNCWIEIGNIMEQPAQYCLKRWGQLRESFCREKRKREEESRSGSGASKRRGFSLFEDMRFLEKHVATKRKTFTNVSSAPRFSSVRTPFNPLTVDNIVQAYKTYLPSQQNMVMPGPLISTPLVMSSPRPSTLAYTSTQVPGPNTPPPTPTPPLAIQMQTPSPRTPLATPSPNRSTSSSCGPISPFEPYSPVTDQSTTTTVYSEPGTVTKYSAFSSLEPNTNSQHGNASRTIATSNRPVGNDMDTRFFSRPQATSLWRNDNIIEESSPRCKMAKPNACYNKELSKPKKIDPVESSFMSLSSAIQDHLINPVHREAAKKINTTDSDDLFGSLIASELRKLDEPDKTAKKARLLQVIYEKE